MRVLAAYWGGPDCWMLCVLMLSWRQDLERAHAQRLASSERLAELQGGRMDIPPAGELLCISDLVVGACVCVSEIVSLSVAVGVGVRVSMGGSIRG